MATAQHARLASIGQDEHRRPLHKIGHDCRANTTALGEQPHPAVVAGDERSLGRCQWDVEVALGVFAVDAQWAGEADRVRSFERGADDHVCKPFLYAELLARVRAVLRRAEGRRGQGVLRVRDLTIDPSTRVVRLAGRRIELSAKEFALLHALAIEPGRVYRKQELLRDVWGYLAVGRTRTLDAHACRLRKKLGPSRRPWVLNVRGVGYKLTEAP